MSLLLQDDQATPAALTENAENVLYACAEHMGLLVTNEEAGVLADFMDKTKLTEAVNIVRLNKQSKLAGLTARAALVIAQQKKDPLFAKYAKAAELKRRLRAVIYKKYSSQATVTARKLLANAGKRNLVDVSNKSSSFSHPESRG